MSIPIDSQARNELPNTAGADHAYVPPLDQEEGPKNGDLKELIHSLFLKCYKLYFKSFTCLN